MAPASRNANTPRTNIPMLRSRSRASWGMVTHAKDQPPRRSTTSHTMPRTISTATVRQMRSVENACSNGILRSTPTSCATVNVPMVETTNATNVRREGTGGSTTRTGRASHTNCRPRTQQKSRRRNTRSIGSRAYDSG
jgi:hypothetical protein